MSTVAAPGWRVRHEGSPQSIGNLTLQDVAEGLAEGRWETTDEVQGPSDTAWVAIESHPQLEEIAADLEPPPPRDLDDHSHVDMNALIDVCLVLLVFFILTTSYAAIIKRLDAPEATPSADGLKVISVKDAERLTVRVNIKMEGDKAVYLVEGRPVEPEYLLAECKSRVGTKTMLLLNYDGEVPYKAVMKVYDAAQGAGVTRVLCAVPNK